MSNQVCIDASLAIEWLLPEKRNREGDALRHEWNLSRIELVSSPIFNAEVTSTLRRQVFFKKILPEEGEAAFRLFLEMRVRTVAHPSVTVLAWEMAKKFNLPRTYDLQYLAVAELIDCPLWTSDKRFVNSLQNKVGRVKWLGDYQGKGLQ